MYDGLTNESPINIADDHQENVVKVIEEYQLSGFAKIDERTIQIPLRATELSPFSEITKQPKRLSPLATHFPFVGVQRQIFLIPPHTPLRVDDANIEIDSQGFGYTRKINDDGSKLVVEHRYEAKLAAITPEQLSAHIEAQRKLSESLWAEVTLRRTASQESQQRLNNLIQGLMKNSQ